MDNNSMGIIGGKNIPRNELTAMHWENRVRGENGVSLRQNYGMGVVGQNLNQYGQSLHFNQQLVISTVSLQTQ